MSVHTSGEEPTGVSKWHDGDETGQTGQTDHL